MIKEIRQFNRYTRRNVIYQSTINIKKRRKILNRRIVQ